MNIDNINQVFQDSKFTSVNEEQVQNSAAQEVSAGGWPATMGNSCVVCITNSCE